MCILVFSTPALIVLASLAPKPVRAPAILLIFAGAYALAPESALRLVLPLALVAVVARAIPAGWTAESKRSVQVSAIWAILGVLLLNPFGRIQVWIAAQDLPTLSNLFDVERFGAGQLLIGVLVTVFSDFLAYWVHRVKHKTRTLWAFHQIHHCAPELGLFAVRRSHPVDTLVGRISLLLPLVLLGQNFLLLILPYAVLRGSIGYWNHANTRLEWRALRRVFVTPSVHRTHHSARSEDHDANFGAVFSFWDRLFGTFREPEEASLTQMGLPDFGGLVETDESVPLWRVIRSQFVEPFRALRSIDAAPANGATVAPRVRH